MTAQLNLGKISVDVVFKDIKNVHLSVYPPNGRVRISAPHRMKLDSIRIFAVSKLDWIKQQQMRLQDQERETPREHVDGESHFVWGKRYILKVLELNTAPEVELSGGKMLLKVRPSSGKQKKRAVVAHFYREQIKTAAASLIAKWAPVMGVSVDRLYVRQMKTKWGSCSPHARSIRLNTELARKPNHCLEYIVVHEMIHLLEPHHGPKFVSLMESFMPQWQFYKDELNRYPLAHQHWDC